MSKELEALEQLKYYNTLANDDFDMTKELDIIETALKNYEMEHTLRIRLENANYELVREKQESDKKLKTFEIIKENLVVGCDESKNDMPCLVLGIRVDKDKMAIIYRTFDKEKIDLLKEALL